MSCPTCEMETQARAMLAVGDTLVARGTPHVAADAYTTAITIFEGQVCPTTIRWLRLHRTLCFQFMGMNVPTTTTTTKSSSSSSNDNIHRSLIHFLYILNQFRRSLIPKKASRLLKKLALNSGRRTCVCGQLCHGTAKCGHGTLEPLSPASPPFFQRVQRIESQEAIHISIEP